jgi:hypothetical protein
MTKRIFYTAENIWCLLASQSTFGFSSDLRLQFIITNSILDIVYRLDGILYTFFKKIPTNALWFLECNFLRNDHRLVSATLWPSSEW